MKTKHLLLGAWLMASVFAFQGCNNSRPTRMEYNPAFDEYLSAFTNGEISKKSSILVQFANEVAKKNQPVSAGLIEFEPRIAGEAVWKDSRTLEFTPAIDLASGQIYTGHVDMSQLVQNIASELATFSFQFKVKDQFVNVSPLAAKSINGQNGDKYMQLKGKVTTHDAEDAKKVEKVLAVYNGNNPMGITWNHTDANTHFFTIDSVKRQNNDYGITLQWNGGTIGATRSSGDLTLNVPSSDKFVLNNTYRYNSPEQHIVLEFSDVLDPSQNLDGLVTLGGNAVKASIGDNQIKIYPNGKLLGKVKLMVAADIRNIQGKNLESPKTETLTFSDANPAVEFVGKGNIIPKSKKMPVVFRTINLNAVDVRVIKVKENNIQQFFQVNQISGREELKRVGKEVLRKKIALDKTQGLELAEWTNHSLDLAELIEPEPGAIYEIALGFRKSYSLYQCDADVVDNTLDPEKPESDMLELPEDWDKPGYDYSYWDYYEEGYEYDDFENPCKTPFYKKADRVALRNILASDLGIIAKQGDNGNLFVVNNLQTTEPMANVTLEFYDFHQDLITTAKTGKDGIAKAELPKKPFILIAKYDKQRGYLRLDDGSALSLSRFDVQGNEYVKGLKGYIYGERGVWRPGDEMFINFILEDKDGKLPAGHPVSFTLKDPRGAVVMRKTSTDGINGFYNFNCQTNEDAPTGNYTASVSVGGATFTKTIKVETIKPNRLKLALDFGKESLTAGEKDVTGTLSASWLSGGAARNMKADIDVTLKSEKAAFPQHGSDFNFHDPAREFSPETNKLFEGELNENGEAKVPLKIKANAKGPGFLRANFTTKVFEPGGDFSIDQFSILYHPYETYIGVRLPKGDEKRNMLLTDVKHKVEVLAVDKDGKLKDAKNLKVFLYKLDWRWWFNSNNDEVASWNGNVDHSPIQKDTIDAIGGKATWELEVKYPDWGRYLVRVCDDKGHCSGQVFYIDWPGWAGRSTEKDPEGATALNFTADKDKYNVGESVTLNIPTGFAGRALVTIENGSKILQANWVDATKGTTQFKFTATPDMAPTAYAYVTLLQPHAQTKNDLPIRMYGVIPLSVEDPQTHLEPVMTVADELKPLQDFTVVVAERKGGPMTYTLAVVDEGLLDLTRYKTPSPWNEFYQRAALGVKTWDMYNDVLGAFGGDIKSLLSIGGDEALDADANRKNDRFKPVVLYAGPFHLEKGQTKTHTFKMPNYVGSVRVMLVAGYKGAYGSADKAVPVRQPLMVMGTMPRVLGTDEKIKLPVTVFAMDEKIKEADITLQVSGGLELVGENARKLTFKQVGDQTITFDVRSLPKAGFASVKILAQSGANKAEYSFDIEVRNSNPRVSNVFAAAIDPSKTWSHAYKPTGMEGTNNATLEVSSIPPINLGKRLKYLIQYPYGCVEQTTSSVFPQLYLTKLMDLDEKTKQEIDKNVKAGIVRLQQFQTSSGAMNYWAGNSDVNEWATNYAGHFLVEAQKAGYTVPAAMMSKWTEFQTQAAKNWSPKGKTEDDLTQAYRLYLLALAGKPELGAMNRLRLKQLEDNAVAAQWHLAAAYHLAGQKDVAQKVATNASTKVKPYQTGTGVTTFGSAFRDQALVLQALSILGNRTEGANLMKEVAARLSDEMWLSTQETAQGLVGIAKFVGEGGVNTNASFEYKVGSGNWQKVNMSKPLWQLTLSAETATTVEFRNGTETMLFPRVIADGIPAVGTETEAANGIAIDLKYVDMEGKKINPEKLEQGTDFAVEVTIKNTGKFNYHELALHHIFPAGWEIFNPRMTGGSNGGDTPEYQDYRDDRVYSFFDLETGKSKTIRILLNSSYLGRYYLPAIAVEAMYDHSINARTKGQWIEVVAQK